MSARRALDVIEVQTPCPANWDEMSGDGTRRFCSYCQKFVHNLSAMPADEAERLVCENAGNLCARFARDAETGQIITLDYAPAPRTSRRRAILVIASVLGSLGFAGAWAANKMLRPPPPTFIAGAIAPLAPPSNGQ